MDGRRNNGNKGHSTRAKSSNDKRLNPAKKFLSQYIDKDFNYEKLKKLLDKLYDDGAKGDVKSTTLFLSYVLGKPKDEVDITTDGDRINSFDLSKASDEQLNALLAIYKNGK